MELANIILEYINVLLWPSITLIAMLTFKTDIENMISKISNIEELSIGSRGLALKMRVAKELIKSEVKSISTDTEKKKESMEVLDIPDNDFLFLEKIFRNTNFYASNNKEKLRYISLSNQGYFSKLSDDEFKPTEKGQKLLGAINIL